jgi:hypothetical protein
MCTAVAFQGRMNVRLPKNWKQTSHLRFLQKTHIKITPHQVQTKPSGKPHMLRFLFFAALVASPVASQTCTLCKGGAAPVIPAANAQICNGVIALLPELNPGACSGFQNGEYPTLCGCPGTVSYQCNVCPKGGTSNPFGVANTNLCNEVKASTIFATTEAQCKTSLAKFDRRFNVTNVCGCPGVQKPCTICPNGANVGNPSKLIGTSNTCSAYDAFLRTFPASSAQCAGKNQTGLAFACGCPGVTTGKPCSICDDGSTRGQPRVANLTMFCLNADYKALFVNTKSCKGNTNAYSQWACGCPNAKPPCTFCENGTTNFVLNRRSDFSQRGQTCAYDQFATQYIVNADCNSIRGTIGQTCGCNNPNAAKNVCRICGDGKSLPNPQIFVPSFGQTCGFIEYYASSEVATQGKTCSFLRGEYVNVCCQGGPDPYPNKNDNPPRPTVRPTVRPTTRRPTVRLVNNKVTVSGSRGGGGGSSRD